MPSVRKIVAEAAKQQQLQAQQAAPAAQTAAAPQTSQASSSSASAPASAVASTAPFAPPARAEAPAKPTRPSEGTIDVVARHAIQGVEVTVTLPKRSKFKHLKKAVAARLGSDEILSRGQLMRKDNGVYTSFKDDKKIGDVRTVLVVCADFSALANVEAPTCSLEEMEVSSDEEEISTLAIGNSGATSSTTPFVRHPDEPLTLEAAVALQKELLEGFSQKSFREELRKLIAQKATLKPAAFGQRRQELFLTVQKDILPHYGFEGTRAGVYKMFAAMGPFVEDEEFVRLGSEINAILEIDSKPETWANLSESCRKLEVPQGLALTDGRADDDDVSEEDDDDHDDSEDDEGNVLSRSAAKARSKAASKARFGLGIGTSVMSAAFPSQSRSLVLGLDEVAAEENHQNDRRAAGQQNPKKEQISDSQLDFECWPAERAPPFTLTIIGSWTAGQPIPMDWDPENGVFVSIMQVGPSGRESFQLLLDGNDEKTIYPHFKDAGPFEVHDILGPDSKSRGRAWTMGTHPEEEVAPGKGFAILAALDVRGKVRQVDWRLLDGAA